MLYGLAKARGYTAKAAAAGAGQGGASGQQTNANAAMIEAIAQGPKVAGASLSDAGGSPGGGLTAEALASMTEAEFAAAMTKLSKAQQRALFGG